MPKVTLVIPVYNTSKYLLRCLDSVRMQTLKDIEVIIINDGSTDDSLRICEDYINTHKLDWKVYSKQNGGLSSARRYGYERSSGDYIAFIDSDDDILPDYCKRMYESLISTDSQLAICGYNLCNGSSSTPNIPALGKSVIENIPEEYGKRLILDTPLGTRIPGFLWMRMMKRDLITEECFINENKVFSEDLIFDLVYSKSINRIVVVSEVLYNYYVNPGSLTLKYRPNMLEMSINLQTFQYSYLSSNNLLDGNASHDFARAAIEGIVAALVNTLRFGNLMDVRKLMKKIRAEEKYKESLKLLRDQRSLERRHKIWCFLINNHISITPYLFYKIKY